MIRHARLALTLLITSGLLLAIGCACATPTHAPPRQTTLPQHLGTRELIELKGPIELHFMGTSAAPVLQSEKGPYILGTTPESELPPEMVRGDMIIWSTEPDHIYVVKGYLSGQQGQMWNGETLRMENVKILEVVSLTKIK